MQHYARLFTVTTALALIAAGAQAAVTISSNATQNMSCSNGVCSPTATKAVLNAGDLETLLGSGNLTVTTTGQGVEARNLDVTAPVSWSNGSVLALDAHNAIAIDSAVSITGGGGLVLTNGGNPRQLAFGRPGNVTFAKLSASLVINGTTYTLANSVQSLASDISGNLSGAFALANDYDASGDGTYSDSPILPDKPFPGSFEGLGHRISNLSINSSAAEYVGLFSTVGTGGVLRDIGLTHARVISAGRAGALAGYVAGDVGISQGLIIRTYSTGLVVGPSAGGLVGQNNGIIALSHSEARVGVYRQYRQGNDRGGLVGQNNSVIDSCYATGGISGSIVGGLVGLNLSPGAIINSYATGNAHGGAGSLGYAGGLLGFNQADNGENGTITDSYSTGAATTTILHHHQYQPGGLVGYDGAQAGSMTDTYWDTDTSGIANLSQGAGYPPNDPGITGLTTQQLQSGLPAGFDPSIWREDANINGGLPYLLDNPPLK
jgi:hypothetical protein